MNATLGSFVLFSLLLALAPGPDNTFVLVQSMRYGARHGLSIVIGLVLGCAVHTTWVVIGVAALLQSHPSMNTLLKIFGSAYMLYLVYQLLREYTAPDLRAGGEQAGSLQSMIRTGFLMNVLNPKVAIFFLSFFPGFLFHDQLSPSAQFGVLGLLFMGVTFAVFGGIALGGSRLSRWLRIDRWSEGFRWIQIAVFLGVVVFLWM